MSNTQSQMHWENWLPFYWESLVCKATPPLVPGSPKLTAPPNRLRSLWSPGV